MKMSLDFDICRVINKGVVNLMEDMDMDKKKTVTKKNLINSISQEKGIHPNDVRHVIQAFLDKMTDCLSQGERLEFRDFGVFEVVERKQKIGRNPKNASVPILIPRRNAVKFTPGKKMREVIETDSEIEEFVSSI
jgi:integration host factor subunit beta